ncbi:hypothetical protein M0Q97_08360 [Candidatus Dojkabacteria bacterium]|jgi:uncharacterized membrane protein|nr:hypothetical protein [Candidatus Dojkabacteria bacterium]
MKEQSLEEWKKRESYYMKMICIAPIIVGILSMISIFIMFPNHNLWEPLPQWTAFYTIFMSFIMILSSLYPGRKLANYLTNKKFKCKDN